MEKILNEILETMKEILAEQRKSPAVNYNIEQLRALIQSKQPEKNRVKLRKILNENNVDTLRTIKESQINKVYNDITNATFEN